MKNLLRDVAFAIVSYTKNKDEQPHEEKERKEKPVDLVWIGADGETEREEPEESSEENGEEEDEDEEPKERKPLFDIGDIVITWNPYIMDYAILDETFTPLYYEIQAIVYDASSGNYRYYLEGEEKWFAEEWLMHPAFPYMAKDTSELGIEEGDLINKNFYHEDEPEVKEKEREFQINYWLTTLHEAIEKNDERERKNAEEALKSLTCGEGDDDK